MRGLDFSKFKKVKDSADHAILKDHKGNEVKILKKQLSPKLRRDLAKLSLHLEEGGEVEDPNKPVEVNINVERDPAAAVDMATAMGVAPQVAPTQMVAPSEEQRRMALARGVAPQMVAPTTQEAPAAVAPTGQPQAQLEPAMPAAGAQASGEPAVAPSRFATGLDQVEQGIRDEANIIGNQGRAEQEALNKGIARQEAMLSRFNNDFKALDTERRSFVKDITDAKIDANKYINNMSTGSKIMTGIGMILGGAGAGLTGGPNLASEFLDKQIDRDIDAQKADISKKQNLLSHNLEQFGNMKSAVDMTRVMLNDIVADKLKREAAAYKDPLAQAKAQQAIGKLNMDNAATLQQMALRQSLAAGGAQAQPEQLIGALVPQHDQKAAREELEMMNSYKKATQDIQQVYAKQAKIGAVGGNIPFSDKKVDFDVNNAIIDQTLRQLQKGQGALTDEDMKAARAFYPKKTDTAAQVERKRQGLQKIIDKKISGGTPTLTQYNIRVGRESSPAASGTINFKAK